VRIKRIHHLTVAVRDLDRAQETFAALLGADLQRDDMMPAFGVRVRDLALGDGCLQLAAPLEQDSPVMRFIERKGEGLYNIALEVDDLDGAVRELAARGVRVSWPVESEPGVRSAFVSMSAAHGLSIQLVEVHDERAAQATARPEREHVTADRDQAPEDAPAPASEREAGEQPEPARVRDLTPDEWSDVD
jgi:methylmalonyl-CoA epimerase